MIPDEMMNQLENDVGNTMNTKIHVATLFSIKMNFPCNINFDL